MYGRLGGPQSWSGCGGEEKKSQPLLGLKLLIIQSIAQCYTTEPSQLPKYCNSVGELISKFPLPKLCGICRILIIFVDCYEHSHTPFRLLTTILLNIEGS
jgi:hypothetical protein